MTDKFLGSAEGGNISNGTISIYGSKIGAKNLDPSRAIKTDSQGRLQTTDLDIADVNNLQSVLDNVISNPFTPPIGQQFIVNGDINCDDLETNNYFSINDEIARTEYISKTLGETTISSNLYTNDIRCSDVKNQIGTTRIDFTDPEDINIQCTELLLNGVPLTSGGAGSELTQDLSIGAYDITNIPQYNGITSLREIALDTQNIQSSVPSVETVFNNVLKCTGKMINEGLSVTNPVGQNDMSGTLLHDGNIELYGNINLNNNNITGFGIGGTQTLQSLNTTVGIYGSDIFALKEKTYNISNVVNDTSTEFIGDILSSSLSNSSLGSPTKQFENLYMTGIGTMGSLITTIGNVIHRLNGTKSFTVGDDSSPLSLLFFKVSITGIISQIKHIFSNGLEPFTNGVGSIGTALKRFNSLFINNVDTNNLSSSTGTIVIGSDIDFQNTYKLLNIETINNIRPSGGLFSESSETSYIGGAGGGVQSIVNQDSTASGSLNIPANGFVVGDTYSFKIGGRITCDNNDSFEINILTNYQLPTQTVFAQINIISDGAQNNGWFEIETEFIIRAIGSAGKVTTNGHYSYYNSSNVSKGVGIDNVVILDTTVDNELDVLFATIDNSITLTVSQVSLTKLY